MEVRFVDGQGGVRSCEPDDVVELFSHEDGFYWIDVPVWDDEAEALLTGLGCHTMVIEGCRQRNYVPMVHGYEDQVFVTTQSPYLGHAGHVHLLELDQIIGHHFLVTVHDSTSRSIERWRGLCPRSPHLMADGPSALLHRIVDVMVDNYAPEVEKIESRLEEPRVHIERPPALLDGVVVAALEVQHAPDRGADD